MPTKPDHSTSKRMSNLCNRPTSSHPRSNKICCNRHSSKSRSNHNTRPENKNNRDHVHKQAKYNARGEKVSKVLSKLHNIRSNDEHNVNNAGSDDQQESNQDMEELRRSILRFLSDRKRRSNYKIDPGNNYGSLNSWASGWPKDDITEELQLMNLRKPLKMKNHIRHMDALDRACEYYCTLTGYSHQDFEGELVNLFEASIGEDFLEVRRQLEKGGGCHWMLDDSMTNTIAEYILSDLGLDETYTDQVNENSNWRTEKRICDPKYYLW